jgi:hypothetical protein
MKVDLLMVSLFVEWIRSFFVNIILGIGAAQLVEGGKEGMRSTI